MTSRNKYTIFVKIPIIVLVVGMTFAVFNHAFNVGLAIAQDGKPALKEYKLTEVQQLKLKVTQQEAQLLQAQLQNVQRQFQDKVSQLMQEANKVKLEQGWPPETIFDPDKLQFSAPSAKEEKK